MSPKKLLKKLLNVNCIKIINASFEVTSQSLYIHIKATKGKQKRLVLRQEKGLIK